MLRLKETVTRTPLTIEAIVDGGKGRPIKLAHRPMRGRVIYIHPRGRFHVVAFPLPGGDVREAFLGVN